MSQPFAMTEVDGFALAMLVMLMMALGSVLLILIRIARNASKHGDEVNELMEDSAKEPVEPSGEESKSKPEAWEKDADWWRK